MSKLFTYALAIAVCLGTTAMLANNNRNLNPTTNAEALLADEQDRASFLAGYRRGYDESLAHVEP